MQFVTRTGTTALLNTAVLPPSLEDWELGEGDNWGKIVKAVKGKFTRKPQDSKKPEASKKRRRILQRLKGKVKSVAGKLGNKVRKTVYNLSLIHISEPTRPY
eukprot:TRINITY_DN15154_c0_g1_i1.p1 TRINITY_DN15154_c0_g1~~TRINITY_DN15154_c0_g1_i1.p1  ORF type:complete len:102 (-),score=24.78 TRINITY_DN15154_c0_g1_i1:86-391(-)